MKSGLITIILVLTTLSSAHASAPPSAFPSASAEEWQERSFVGNTKYEVVEEDGIGILKATADSTASALFNKVKVDVKSTPSLDWAWKVEGIYNVDDEQSKSGDDFPARLYVTARTGPLPWQVIAINYVWSSNQDIDTHWRSPFTNKSVMVAVQSGETNAGKWVTHRRNVVEDFKKYFNEDVDSLVGYAVMVDGDNSKSAGTAYFGGINFSSFFAE